MYRAPTRFDVALLLAAAPRDGARLERCRALGEGERVVARREREVLVGRRRDVDGETGGVSGGPVARHVHVSEARVVARDAVLPAVGQAAVQAELRPRQRGRRRRRGFRDRAKLALDQLVERHALGRRRRLVGDLFDRDLAQHVGRQAVAHVPDRLGRGLGRGHRALARQRDRHRRHLGSPGLMPQPLHRRLVAALVRDEVVDAGGRRGEHEGAVARRVHAHERAVADVEEDDEHARKGSLGVTHDTGNRRRGRRTSEGQPAEDEPEGRSGQDGHMPFHKPGPRVQARKYRFPESQLPIGDETPEIEDGRPILAGRTDPSRRGRRSRGFP